MASSESSATGSPQRPPALTAEGCDARQQRLAAALKRAGYDAIVIQHPGHVHALTGFWTRSVFQRLLVVTAEGETILAADSPAPGTHATSHIRYPSNHLGTLVEDPA